MGQDEGGSDIHTHSTLFTENTGHIGAQKNVSPHQYTDGAMGSILYYMYRNSARDRICVHGPGRPLGHLLAPGPALQAGLVDSTVFLS